MVHQLFSRFTNGIFCVEHKNKVIAYGELPPGLVQGSIVNNNNNHDIICSNTIIIENKNEFNSGVLRGTIGIGETYFQEHWSYNNKTQDLGDLMTHLFWNILNTASPYTSYLIYLSANEWKEWFNRLVYSKNQYKDANDVCYHYFDHNFFKYMLDATMTYTSAVYVGDDGGDYQNELHEAQIRKVRTLYDKLHLQKQQSTSKAEVRITNHNILDIGSGWGFLANFMANQSTTNSVNNVTGITIAMDQYHYSIVSDNQFYENVLSEPLYELMDYRDLPNVYGNAFFDGITSVGVFEHIHIKGMDQWFHVIYDALKEDTYFVMTTIISTQSFANGIKTYINKENACESANYVNKYVFPGTCLLLLDWIRESAIKTGFVPMHIEHTGIHYAKTVKHWRLNMDKNINDILYSKHSSVIDRERYLLYHIYLAMAEAAFRIGKNDQVQIVFYKPSKDNIHTSPFDLYEKHI